MTMDLIEPTPVPDIYADDIAMVELLGPNVRLTYFTWQGGERIVVCKLVRPAASVKGTVQALVDRARAAKQEDQLHMH